MLAVPLVEIYCTSCWRIFLRRIPFETILVSQTSYSPRICLLDAKGQEFPKKNMFPNDGIFHGDESNGTKWKTSPNKSLNPSH